MTNEFVVHQVSDLWKLVERDRKRKEEQSKQAAVKAIETERDGRTKTNAPRVVQLFPEIKLTVKTLNHLDPEVPLPELLKIMTENGTIDVADFVTDFTTSGHVDSLTDSVDTAADEQSILAADRVINTEQDGHMDRTQVSAPQERVIHSPAEKELRVNTLNFLKSHLSEPVLLEIVTIFRQDRYVIVRQKKEIDALNEEISRLKNDQLMKVCRK